jgi:hypothetical protein
MAFVKTLAKGGLFGLAGLAATSAFEKEQAQTSVARLPGDNRTAFNFARQPKRLY